MRKKHIQSVITFVLTFVLAIGVFGRTVSASETENKYRVFLKDIVAQLSRQKSKIFIMN